MVFVSVAISATAIIIFICVKICGPSKVLLTQGTQHSISPVYSLELEPPKYEDCCNNERLPTYQDLFDCEAQVKLNTGHSTYVDVESICLTFNDTDVV